MHPPVPSNIGKYIKIHQITHGIFRFIRRNEWIDKVYTEPNQLLAAPVRVKEIKLDSYKKNSIKSTSWTTDPRRRSKKEADLRFLYLHGAQSYG
jgi:hypothetical protein